MGKFILNEDEAVAIIDWEPKSQFNDKLIGARPLYTYFSEKELAEYDITSRKDEFLTWAEKICQEVADHSFQLFDVMNSVNDFITDVMGLSMFGPEYQNELKDYIVELELNAIDCSSGKIRPEVREDDISARTMNHIFNIKMPELDLAATGKYWVRTLVDTIIKQILMKHIPFEDFKKAVKSLNIWEHLDPPENLVKQIRKYHLDLKYAKSHNQLEKAREITSRLAAQLRDTTWEATFKDIYTDNKKIIKGIGFDSNFNIFINSPDIDIISFSILENDF